MYAGSRKRKFGFVGVGGLAALFACANTGHAGEHPQLLISSADLPRLRHACGVGPPALNLPDGSRYGALAGDFQAVRAALGTRLGSDALPGEVLAAAFLHLVDPKDIADAGRLQLVHGFLERPTWTALDPLEVVVALDWCWSELPPASRREFLLNLRTRAEPLAPSDSLLEPRRFREKLALLALAAAVDARDDDSPSWTALRTQLLEAGRAYFSTTFPTVVEWRSLSPTGPAVAAREESDAALAIEIATRVLGRDAWPDYESTVGRWLEHYVFAALEHPAVRHDFLHDDGSEAPLTPAAAWGDLLPVTAHLIAFRARDPAAALLATRIEATLRDSAGDERRQLWRWVPIALPIASIPACDPAHLPTGRNLGSAVIFRGGAGPAATAVWIDAAGPFLRRRQHFDAGHFLIERGGVLAGSAGDDVTYEAITSKGGAQHLGEQREPFDFEQFCTASIAHNALVVWDPARRTDWYKARYLPAGGQRCIENTCTDFATLLDAQARQTGRALAYGWHGDSAYLVLDLAPAYENRVVTAYTREFIFIWGRALIVVDRVELPRGRTVPTWVLNLPARPQVDGADLRAEGRVAGSTNEGGVWRCDAANALNWSDRDGRLWMCPLLPAPRCLRVVGGPARKLVVPGGRHAERAYVGGDPNGFERLIVPAQRPGAQNAWYRLGEPTLLGAEFGQPPHWGRLELEPLEASSAVTFLTVLITDDATASAAPSATVEPVEDALVVRLRAGEDEATIRVPAAAPGGGTLEVGRPTPQTWTFPTKVLPDEPLPLAGRR